MWSGVSADGRTGGVTCPPPPPPPLGGHEDAAADWLAREEELAELTSLERLL